MNNQNYLKIAILAAKESKKIFVKNFGKAKGVTKKNGNFRDLVTESDKQIESQIRKLILKNFPTHKIIGEEFGQNQINKKDLVWIIDPIDGTTNFIQGIPFCCISIALWDEKGPLVAALYAPILNQLFTAVRGKGAQLNGKPIHTSEVKNLQQAIGGIGWFEIKNAPELFSKIVKHCRKIRVMASNALQICLVGSGVYNFHIAKDVKIWDFAAAILIASEAGGKVTDFQGKKPNLLTKSIVATNRKIHSQTIQAVS